MGIKSKNLSNISLQRTTLGNKDVNIINQYDFIPAKTIEEAENFISNYFNDIPVQYDGMSLEAANMTNEIIIKDLNFKPFKNKNLLNGIYTVYSEKDPFDHFLETGGLAAVELTKQGIYGNKFHLLINMDALSDVLGSNWKPGLLSDKIENIEKQKGLLDEDWKAYTQYWIKNYEKFYPGDLLDAYKDMQKEKDYLLKKEKHLQIMKQMGIQRWGGADYSSDDKQYFAMVLTHELGHLRHFDIVPSSSNLSMRNKNKELHKLLEKCPPITAYAKMSNRPEENFAEHYTLYRNCPEILKEHFPLNYKEFDKIFK